MRIWTSEHIFSHPWETVTQAVWRKYPNPHKPEVVGTDVVDRRVVDGVLHTHRLISSRWGLPQWAQIILGSERVCYGYEHSEVNPQERSMMMHSRNLTFSGVVSLDETMTYSPDPEDFDKTVLKQETIITVSGVPLTSYMENYLLNSISRNSSKGREAMEWIISKINIEVEGLMTTCMRGTTGLLTSIEGMKDTAIKSVDGLSDKAKKSIDDLSTVIKKAELSDKAKKSIDDISISTKKKYHGRNKSFGNTQSKNSPDLIAVDV